MSGQEVKQRLWRSVAYALIPLVIQPPFFNSQDHHMWDGPSHGNSYSRECLQVPLKASLLRHFPHQAIPLSSYISVCIKLTKPTDTLWNLGGFMNRNMSDIRTAWVPGNFYSEKAGMWAFHSMESILCLIILGIKNQHILDKNQVFFFKEQCFIFYQHLYHSHVTSAYL